MKMSLHFLLWLTTAAATICSWVVCAVDMGTGVAFLTLLLTLGCGLWGFTAFSPRQTTVRNAYCSFCRKSHTEVGPLVEGPDRVYICAACCELSTNILQAEQKRREAESST